MATPSREDDESALNDPSVGQRIDQFLQNQGRELDLRSQELELQKISVHQEHDYARESLAAQERIMLEQLRAQRRHNTDLYWFIGICALIGAIILGLAIWMNKDQIALEIIKDLAMILGGGAGGYALGKNRPQTPAPDDS